MEDGSCWARAGVTEKRLATAPGFRRPASRARPRSRRFGVELLLLKDDLRVAAQVGAVDAGVHRGPGDLEIEVVRRGVLDRCLTDHRGAQRGAILHVELQER